MSIMINGNESWSTRSGIFECIVEETRELFKDNEQSCIKEIYDPLDNYQQFIDLGNISAGDFNLFYRHCKQAMDGFPDSERGKIPDEEYMPVILGNWSHLLENLRKDPRYRGQQETE
ncbi:MAG: hypothetical protein FWG40_05670 [Peptococcaceae bacterium]|nr:hypothetical protein [Peptococcaceae bacterium]